MENILKVKIPATLKNQGLARAISAAYAAEFDPTVDEMSEIKTAVSEAFSNAVIHGYRHDSTKDVELEMGYISADTVLIKVKDKGQGIENIAKAMEPLFSTDTSEERTGMGFTVMESFMDRVKVDSKVGEGTTVTLLKKLDTYCEA